jgi:ribose 5-phosphate isomerase RpiB
VRVAIGSDHAGYDLKEAVAPLLRNAGHEVIDVGTDSEESVDYPVYASAGPASASRSPPTRWTACER